MGGGLVLHRVGLRGRLKAARYEGPIARAHRLSQGIPDDPPTPVKPLVEQPQLGEPSRWLPPREWYERTAEPTHSRWGQYPVYPEPKPLWLRGREQLYQKVKFKSVEEQMERFRPKGRNQNSIFNVVEEEEEPVWLTEQLTVGHHLSMTMNFDFVGVGPRRD